MYVRGWSFSGLGATQEEYDAAWWVYNEAFTAWAGDHAAWRREQELREAQALAVAEGAAWSARMAEYKEAMEIYARHLRAWAGQRDLCAATTASYDALLQQWKGCGVQQKARYWQAVERAKAMFPGQEPVAGFVCQGAALQRDRAAACQAMYVAGWNPSGLGAVSDDPCFLAELPVCEAPCPHPGPRPICDPGPPPVEPTHPGAPPVVPRRVPDDRPEPQMPLMPTIEVTPPLPPPAVREEPPPLPPPAVKEEPPPVIGPPAVALPDCIPYDLKQEAIEMCRQVSTSGLIGIGQLPEPFASAPCQAANLPVCPEEPREEEAPPTKKASMMVGGIVLLVAAALGYGVYRSVKK
jgi:hypothetical protein